MGRQSVAPTASTAAQPIVATDVRPLVLREAQSIWDERDAKRSGEPETIEADAEETAIAAAWIVQKLRDFYLQAAPNWCI